MGKTELTFAAIASMFGLSSRGARTKVRSNRSNFSLGFNGPGRGGNKDARKKGHKHKHNPSYSGLRKFSRGIGVKPKNRYLMHVTEKPVFCHLGRDKYGNKVA